MLSLLNSTQRRCQHDSIKVVTVALEGLENILKAASNLNNNDVFERIVGLISEAGGLNAIEELQNHENQGKKITS